MYENNQRTDGFPGEGSLPLEAYQMLEKKTNAEMGIQSGVGAEREKGVKIAKNGEKGIQIAMIRVLAMRSYVERVGK